MSNPIHGQSPHSLPGMPPAIPGAVPIPSVSPEGPVFQDLLLGAIGDVNTMEASAQEGIREHLLGGSDITQVEALSELKKAELSMRTLLQVRNKMLEAYQEIINLRM